MFGKMFCVFMMFCQDKFIQRIGRIRSRNNFKNIAAAVVKDNNSRVRRDVIVPQTIDVIEKTEISGYQNRLFLVFHGKSHRRRSGTVNSAGAAVAIDAVFLKVK